MERREFIKHMGLVLAASCSVSPLSWPLAALADPPTIRLAFLADAHLKDGDKARPEARALVRAVAELRLLKPAPRLVLFAGDLAHNGDPRALALGQEILSDLPAPHLMVMGEGDGLPDGAAAWRRLFGEPWFSHLLQNTANEKPKTVCQILGLHTAWCPGPGGPAFRVGESGRRWLARELARLDPEVPLVILSHAPLAPIYRPWQQWTVDGPEVMPLLARFRQVLCLHGHTHNGVASGQLPVASNSNDFGERFLSEQRKLKTEKRLLSISLPATAWPWPQALQGTPAHLRPGLGPAGCGWLLLAAGSTSLQLQPQIWQA
jgi:Icc protein